MPVNPFSAILIALGDLDFVFIYIDDILVASSSPDEHAKHLRIVFQRLKEFYLRLNAEKCVLGAPELKFLGYIINGKGIRPIPEKIEAISKFPRPQTISDLRRFLSMINFYRNIPRAADTQALLNSLLIDARKNDKRAIAWSDELIEAFEKTKDGLAKAAMLVHPHIGAKLQIVVDASDSAMGCPRTKKNRILGSP